MTVSHLTPSAVPIQQIWTAQNRTKSRHSLTIHAVHLPRTSDTRNFDVPNDESPQNNSSPKPHCVSKVIIINQLAIQTSPPFPYFRRWGKAGDFPFCEVDFTWKLKFEPKLSTPSPCRFSMCVGTVFKQIFTLFSFMSPSSRVTVRLHERRVSSPLMMFSKSCVWRWVIFPPFFPPRIISARGNYLQPSAPSGGGDSGFFRRRQCALSNVSFTYVGVKCTVAASVSLFWNIFIHLFSRSVAAAAAGGGLWRNRE